MQHEQTPAASPKNRLSMYANAAQHESLLRLLSLLATCGVDPMAPPVLAGGSRASGWQPPALAL